MQDLKEIQIEIKKELGGSNLNHLISWFMNQCLVRLYFGCHVANPTTYQTYLKGSKQDSIRIYFFKLENDQEIYCQSYKLLNDQNQALNILGQSEEFQRNLYDAIQFIKNINNK